MMRGILMRSIVRIDAPPPFPTKPPRVDAKGKPILHITHRVVAGEPMFIDLKSANENNPGE